MDKAGAYGIQDWIGLTHISKIEGSYTNVVGLPAFSLYRELSIIAEMMGSKAGGATFIPS